jgi:hypothetical protein
VRNSAMGFAVIWCAASAMMVWSDANMVAARL